MKKLKKKSASARKEKIKINAKKERKDTPTEHAICLITSMKELF